MKQTLENFNREQGFTLIEMLVVLTIIGLLAAVAMSNLSARPAFVDRAKFRADFKAAVSRASQHALTTGQAVPIDLSTIDRKDVTIVPAFAGDGPPSAYPDGSTSGGILVLNGMPLLSLDWMTGRIVDASR